MLHATQLIGHAVGLLYFSSYLRYFRNFATSICVDVFSFHGPHSNRTGKRRHCASGSMTYNRDAVVEQRFSEDDDLEDVVDVE